MKLAELTPLKKSKHLARISVAFADTETFGTKSDVFRCGSVAYIKQGKEKVQTMWNIEDLFQFCQRFDVVYFYNVQFDSAFFRNFAFKNNLQETIIESGNKILGCMFFEIQPHSKKLLKLFTLKDMLQFSGSPPCSLKICAKDYGISLQKYDVDFDNCSDKDIQHHCEIDALLLLKFAYLCRNIYWENYNVDIFHKKIYSVPAVAVKVFRSNFLKQPIENPFARIVYEANARGHYKINTKLFDFCKEAYKGGFCNVFSTELRENEVSFDISSAYPFAMSALRFPTGRPYFTSDYYFWRKMVQKIPGIGRVRAIIPPHIGICGIREGKLVEICGIQTETLTSIEILNIEKNGGKILEFTGIYFEDYDSHNTAMRYASHFYREKRKHKGGQRSCDKLNLNSLYGKWGQSIYQSKKVYRFFKSEADCYNYEATSEKVVTTQKIGNGFLTYYEVESISFKPFQNIIWAALVTAFVRIYIIQNAYRVNGDYTDTDSIKFQEQFLPQMENIGEGLGFFEYEGKFDVFRAVAPKNYAGRYSKNTIEKGEDNSGNILVRMKGVPNRFKYEVFYDILDGKETIETPEFTAFMGMSESIHAQNYLIKSDIIGGIRTRQRTLHPKPKNIDKGEQI